MDTTIHPPTPPSPSTPVILDSPWYSTPNNSIHQFGRASSGHETSLSHLVSEVVKESSQLLLALQNLDNLPYGQPPLNDNYDEGDAAERSGEFTFFPMGRGQSFMWGRFIVWRKVGMGTRSSTWLAQDMRTEQATYVALKVHETRVAEEPHHRDIIDFISTLRGGDHNHVGFKHILLEEEFFYERSIIPGLHWCSTMKLMARCLDDRWMSCLPVSVTQSVTKQILEGLDYLHSHGIFHTDLKLDNILCELDPKFRIERLLAYNPAEMKRDIVFTLPNGDEYDLLLFKQQPVAQYVAFPLRIRIADLGSAQWIASPTAQEIMPESLKAPEVILRKKGPKVGVMGWNEKVDIWCVPNLVFQMLTGSYLIPISATLRWTHLEFALQCMQKWFGPFPAHLLDECEDKELYFSPDNQLKKDVPVRLNDMRNRIGLIRSKMDGNQLDVLEAFLRSMLQLDPDVRPSARKCLEDRWFLEDYTVSETS